MEMEEYSYKKSGVHLKSAQMLTDMLSCNLKSANFNNFAGIFEHPALPEYYLTGAADGIGTKIIPLIERKFYKTIAIDLAAMNLNDLICTGAKPLFFLDYIAANVLNPKEISNFITELNTVLKSYNCTLIGGETSELGDFIKRGMFDAAGFAAGLVHKTKLIKKENVKENDIIVSLKSTGVHSNGFSLVRKLYSDGHLTEKDFLKSLAPTAIYVNEILQLCDEGLVSALANITGGGILSNLERVIPDGFQAKLNKHALPEIEIFETIKKVVNEDEMFRTFNMGAGFCIITKEKYLKKVLEVTKTHSPFVFGVIKKAKEGENNAKAAF